jgi:O-antigen ligase
MLAGVPKLTTAESRKASLGAPFWLLVAYFFFEYVRPQQFLPFLAPLRLGLILTILLFLFWLVRGDKTVMREPLVLLYCLFVVLAASGVVFAVNQFWVFQNAKILALYLVAATLPSTTFLANDRALLKFFNVWLVMHVVLAVMSIDEGGKGSGSFLADENDWALALNMAIPYAFFLSQAPGNSRRAKVLYLTAAGILLLAVVVTGSRGGFVGLVATVAGLLYFSRHRIRNLLVISAFGLIVAAFWLPKDYVDDMKTITDTEESTAAERLYSWRRSMEMFYDYPILGVGAGNWGWRVNEYELKRPAWETRDRRLLGGRVAHSLYFTLIPEFGLAGIIVYAAILVLLSRKLFALARAPDHPAPIAAAPSAHLALLAKAMLVSLLAFLSSGAFLSVLYYPHLWYLIGFALALHYAAVKAGYLRLYSASGKTNDARAGAH